MKAIKNGNRLPLTLTLHALGLISVIGITQQPVRAFQIDTTDTDNGKKNGTPIYNTFYQNGVSSTQIGVNGSPTYSTNGTHDVGNFSLFGELSQNTGLGNINEVLVYNNSSGNNGAALGSGTVEYLAETLAQTQGGDGIPVYNTTALVLGLGVNQTGNQPNFAFETFEFKLQIPGSGCTNENINGVTAPTCTFSVGTPGTTALTLVAAGGNNSSEARVQMDLDPYLVNGNDLLSTYNYLNPDNTRNSSHIAGNYNYQVSSIGADTGGSDRFFVSSGLTSVAEDVSFVQTIPFEFSPSLGIILSLSFFGFSALKQRLLK